MGYPIALNNSTEPIEFLMVLSADHITGATGKTPTVTICKSGGTFAAPVGAVTEKGNGWYAIAGSTADASTLGALLLNATAAGCDPCDDTFTVVNYNPTSYTINSAQAVSPVDVTCADLINEAFEELSIYNASESPDGFNASLGLRKLTRLFDNWNAVRAMIFESTITAYTLTADLQPHTIGPTGDFVVASRPVSIESANIIITDDIRNPLILRSRQWWMTVTTPDISSPIPTDLYYEPSWPNGTLTLWPVPSTAYQIELMVRGLISAVELTTVISMPPGYRDAITLTLAEELAAPMRVQASPQTIRSAAQARSRIAANNVESVPLTTSDPGMPTGQTRNISTWNWLYGSDSPGCIL